LNLDTVLEQHIYNAVPFVKSFIKSFQIVNHIFFGSCTKIWEIIDNFINLFLFFSELNQCFGIFLFCPANTKISSFADRFDSQSLKGYGIISIYKSGIIEIEGNYYS